MANSAATTTETVLIDFVINDEQVDSALDVLQRTGQVDKQTAEQFKKTNAELAKREKIIDDLSKQLRETQSQNAKSIADVEARMQAFIQEFVEGFSEGVVETLKEAGFEFDEFGQIINKNTKNAGDNLDNLKKKIKDTPAVGPFDALNKKLVESRKRILDISTELQRLSASGGKGTERFDKLTKQLQTAQAEYQRVEDQVEAVNKSVGDLGTSSDRARQKQESLKSQLREMTQQLQLMKQRGEDNTEEYLALAKAAGELKDTIGDAAAEINNFASDTSNIDGLIASAQGVAGVFAVAQGAVGAFGVQSEELDEVMLKVNSSLAVLQGLQAIGNTLQKESAAVTFLQTAAQKAYNVVVGESIGLTAAFRVALAATGIGLVVIAVLALVNALDKQNKQLEDANKLIDRNKDLLKADADAIEDLAEKEEARAEAAGAKESELIRIRGRSLQQQRASILAQNEILATQRDSLDNTSEAWFNLNKAIEDNNAAISDIDNKSIIEQINLDKQLRSEQLQGIADTLAAQLAGATKNSKRELDLAKQSARARAAVDLNEAGQNAEKRLLIEAQLQKDLRDLDLQYARVRQENRIAGIDASLTLLQQKNRAINERQTQEEIDLQKQKIAEEAKLALMQEGLTEKQILAIKRKSISDQIQLQRDFTKQDKINALNDFIDRNNAQLANIKLTNKERLDLQEQNLIAAAEAEIVSNAGLADKIKAIRAKLNEDLRALRLAALQKQLNDELSIESSRTGVLRRANERIVDDQRKTLSQRISAVNQIAALDIAAVNKQQDALEESRRRGLITQEDYIVQYEKLKDDELKITEDAELKKRQLQKETFQQTLDFTVNTLNQAAALFAEFGAQELQRQEDRIAEQRQRIDQLKEAGAITEKEAEARNKRLDQQDRQLKRKQAEREKAVAIFQAIINTAAAVAKALATGGPVFAAIVGALGAAQIALIANKPIPKFGKGKKGNYEGPAEIGETGPELWQHNGDMYLAKKSSIVWMGAKDKVFNPKETVAMLDHSNMQPYIIKDRETNQYKQVYQHIDLDKLGKVISDNMPKVGFNIDRNGITTYMHMRNSFEKYLNDRRGYK